MYRKGCAFNIFVVKQTTLKKTIHSIPINRELNCQKGDFQSFEGGTVEKAQIRIYWRLL